MPKNLIQNLDRMNYQQLIDGYKKAGVKLIEYGRVREGGRLYPLYKIVVGRKDWPLVLITAGFHGEEAGGPISFLKNIKKIAAYARKKKVNLVIYPCVNPSGFDLRQRYNASKEKFCNYFIQYEIKPGQWVGMLKRKEKFLRFRLIDSPAKEGRALRADLVKEGFFRKLPKAVLDIHQDINLKTDIYVYIFEDEEFYEQIMKKCDRFAERARSDPAFDYEAGRKVHYRINRNGFLYLHDGALTDMFYRLGVKHPITVETSAKAPIVKVARINLLWMKAAVDWATGG